MSRAFPDDPKVWWAEAAIEETVRVYVQQWNIDLVCLPCAADRR